MSSELLTAFARGVTRLLPWAYRQFRRSQNGNNLLDKARNSGNNASQTDSETSQSGDVFGGVSTINTPKHPATQGFLFSQNVGPYIRPTAFSETMISKTAAAAAEHRVATTAHASGEARTK